jgi:DNA-binding response OmpR family regulator
MLAEHGYTMLEARNGAEALGVAESHPTPIHLLLTDVVMPGMDGFALARRMASFHPETRVLFISGHADDRPDVRKGLEHTSLSYLLKPFTPQTLRQKIHAVLDAPELPKTPKQMTAPRFAKVLPVSYQVAGDRGWQRGITVNISESGVLLEAAKPVALGARLELAFELPEKLGRFEAGPVTCTGRVRRHGRPTRSAPYPLGVQFVTA